MVIAHEGQITERYTRAVDQIGHRKLEVRVGGIYALERIAKDSAEKDYWTIIEILTAYIRSHGSIQGEPLTQNISENYTLNYQKQNDPLPKPEVLPDLRQQSAPEINADIHAVMTVLTRRTRWLNHGEPGGLDLKGIYAPYISLQEIHLEETNLRKAWLKGVNFTEAYLERADLRDINLENAILCNANLRRVDLKDARLADADLRSAQLEYADFTGAHLERADMRNTFLKNVSLPHSHLENANLTYAHLTEANLKGAHLENADFSDAHLEGARLQEVSGLTHKQVREAFVNKWTQLPDYVDSEELATVPKRE